MRNIRCLKPHLSADALKIVGHQFTASGIDYGNSKFIGIPGRCVIVHFYKIHRISYLAFLILVI